MVGQCQQEAEQQQEKSDALEKYDGQISVIWKCTNLKRVITFIF
jgi:hypothetical protein